MARPPAVSSGLSLNADRAISAVRGPIDTLLVAGGTGARRRPGTSCFSAGSGAAAARSRRVASVCTGAFLLAEAGLLDGRRATTHWARCDALAERYPQITVEPDPIFVRDGNVFTSAGVTAGMDLALALVEEDHGARRRARRPRAGSCCSSGAPADQSQFSAQLAAQPADAREPLRELQALDRRAPRRRPLASPPLAAPRLHERAQLRARASRRETGTTPAAYVEARASSARAASSRRPTTPRRGRRRRVRLRHRRDDAPRVPPPPRRQHPPPVPRALRAA